MERGPKDLSLKDLRIVLENPKGSYKSFESEDGSEASTYPLKGITYPVDYGHIEGFVGEDGDDLDVFVGTGSIQGFIKVWRLDVPEETKAVLNVTEEEFEAIKDVFEPVLKEVVVLTENDILAKIATFKA
jgi:inorganic pyrophosphatase